MKPGTKAIRLFEHLEISNCLLDGGFNSKSKADAFALRPHAQVDNLVTRKRFFDPLTHIGDKSCGT
jgi:hypothetical protein